MTTLDPAASEAAERCVYCPKLCRFSCPVGHESARENLTPWGKMSLASLSVPGPEPVKLPSSWEALAKRARALLDAGPARELDADTAEAFYACTGCLRCSTWCEHGNDVPHALYQARAAAVEAGVAPAAARAVADRFQRQGHAQDADAEAALAALAERYVDPPAAAAVLFAGCEAPSSAPDSIPATLSAAARLGAPLALARKVVCCGRPLFEAGYREEFAEHVSRSWDMLGEREVVVASAACGRALSEWAKEVGVEPRGQVVHVTTYLARRLGPNVQAPPLPMSVLYHDPCHLGRGLGEFEAPRKLLDAAIEGDVLEAPTARRESDCCGGSGLLPRTYPAIARAMAMTRADEIRSTGAQVVATACPACRESLRSAGLQVRDVAEIVEEWLNGQGRRSTEER